MVTHYKDIMSKESECGERGRLALDIENVDCLNCLNSVKKEWERQVKNFTEHPLINAKLGLKRTIKRIKEVSLLSSHYLIYLI